MATPSLRSVRIQNVRSLADTGHVPLLPITLLVGRNSSGKSTFLRSFPLLRQSVERDTTGPILWYGSLVDFGSHETAVRRGHEDAGITLSFRATVGPANDVTISFYRDAAPVLEAVDVEVEVDLHAVGRDKKTVATGCRLRMLDDEVDLTFSDGAVTEFRVNELDVLDAVGPYVLAQQGGLLPDVIPTRPPRRGETARKSEPPRPLRRRRVDPIVDRIQSSIDPFFHGNTDPVKRWRAAMDIGYGSPEETLRSLRVASNVPSWERQTARLRTGHTRFKQIRSRVLARTVPLLIRLTDHAITQMARSVTYSNPLRAAAERYYRKQDLAVDEIDPGGANLAMYLRSLTDRERVAFRAWTERHLGFGVVASSLQGHVSVDVVVDDNERVNLTDMGFGYSQVLPVVAQIWDRTARTRRRLRRPKALRSVVFAIEQPELHLHPALQARVADLLVRTARAAREAGFEVRFVVETHSSVIVNRIGQLIAEGDGVHPDDVQVLLFESESPSDTSVRAATFDSRGVLQDWPYGFFEPDLIEPVEGEVPTS